MTEDPESFKIGSGNRKVQQNYEITTDMNNLLIQTHYPKDNNLETQSMISVVTDNPIPYGEPSAAERINRINALNKKGNYVDPKLYQKQREENQQQNISYSPKNMDKNKENYMGSMLDNYNLVQEKMVHNNISLIILKSL